MVLIKLGILFLLILVLLRLKIHFIAVILAVGVLLGLWFHLGFMDILQASWAALRNTETLSLAGIVGLILILSELLQSSGQLARLSQAIVDMFGLYRVTYTVLPALIGLLPMPGGALFTAPLMDDVSNDIIPAHKKTLINFWFRHIWEYSWPMYPGLLLAASISQVNQNKMAVLQFPLTIIAVIVGLLIIFPGIKIASVAPNRQKWTVAAALYLGYLLMPIILVIGLIMFINLTTPFKLSVSADADILANLNMLLALAISLAWTILTILVTRKLRPVQLLKSIFAKWHIYQMMLIVASVLVFAGILESSTATRELVQYFSSGGNQIPFSYLLILVVLLPLIVGLLTGMTMAVVGITFPLIFATLHSTGAGVNVLPWAVLAYVSAVSGVMVSPLHLCLILTASYYGITIMKVYKTLIPIAVIILVSCLLLFGALMFFKFTW